jgi:DNA ligase-1
MNRFARLLDALILSPARNAKLRLLVEHFRGVPDPDRGWALAALVGALNFRHAKPAVVRALAESRIDPTLFALSYDYVGDLAETVALIWPAPGTPPGPPPGLDEIVDALAHATRARVPALLADWLDRLDADGRWALLKLITGGMRVGASSRLAKTALAELGGVEVARIEEIWHGLTPPYDALFAWLEGRGPMPGGGDRLGFRPLMLAHPLEDDDASSLDAAAYAAEWKWDGIRVQLVGDGLQRRIYSRTGDEISAAFPEIAQDFDRDAVLDGELLVGRDGAVAPFNDLQQRLNRKSPTKTLLERHPAFVRLYDILFDRSEDLRALPFAERRRRLEAWYAREIAGTPRAARLDLSPPLPVDGLAALAALRAESAARGAEGLMLKRLDAPYAAGRPKGLWYKWKRDPLRIDAVVMYAQRGHGKRSSFYSDFTFGCWRGDDELVPVGKAYFGFTDEELARLDRWVRAHAVDRFGPVLVVERRLVCELAFDGVQRSTRHKSGIALRFPRIARIRWDKPAAEADRVAALERLIADHAAAPDEAPADPR